ncbi:Uncharacterised protein [Burkholderia pseudomallei]|nr:Uncharacterised protein [Burkholderia pseudomallei]CAJ7617493.1 Uncharacterised protein [Burkholderia pseudomallei]
MKSLSALNSDAGTESDTVAALVAPRRTYFPSRSTGKRLYCARCRDPGYRGSFLSAMVLCFNSEKP